YADSEAAEAVGVGRRNLDERYIYRHLARLEQALDFAEEDGGVVSAAIIHGFADVATDKDRVVAKVPSHFRLDVAGVVQRHHVHDFYVMHFGAALDQRIHQDLWGRAAGMDV